MAKGRDEAPSNPRSAPKALTSVHVVPAPSTLRVRPHTSESKLPKGVGHSHSWEVYLLRNGNSEYVLCMSCIK